MFRKRRRKKKKLREVDEVEAESNAENSFRLKENDAFLRALPNDDDDDDVQDVGGVKEVRTVLQRMGRKINSDEPKTLPSSEIESNVLTSGPEYVTEETHTNRTIYGEGGDVVPDKVLGEETGKSDRLDWFSQATRHNNTDDKAEDDTTTNHRKSEYGSRAASLSESRASSGSVHTENLRDKASCIRSLSSVKEEVRLSLERSRLSRSNGVTRIEVASGELGRVEERIKEIEALLKSEGHRGE